jgi:hypothetical protein
MNQIHLSDVLTVVNFLPIDSHTNIRNLLPAHYLSMAKWNEVNIFIRLRRFCLILSSSPPLREAQDHFRALSWCCCHSSHIILRPPCYVSYRSQDMRKYEVEMVTSGITVIRSFVKIYFLGSNIRRGTYAAWRSHRWKFFSPLKV